MAQSLLHILQRGFFMGNMNIKHLSAFAMVLMTLSACKQPSTFVPTSTDKFVNHTLDVYEQAEKLLQADYVFVLDTSYSMGARGNPNDNLAYQDELQYHMEDFLSELQTQKVDYRIAFVRGNTHANSVSTIASSFMGPMVALGDSTASLFSYLKLVGEPLQENSNFLLEAAKKSMDTEASGFLRHAAQLVYAFISDSDDQSQQYVNANRSEEYYNAALRTYKHHPHYVSARSYVLGMSAECTPSSYIPGSSAGTRIGHVATEIDARKNLPGCVDKVPLDMLADIARNVTKKTNRFTLTQYPMPGTLRVEINGVVIPEATNWTYLDETNEIVFESGKEPHFEASLLIDYEIAFKLSRSPKIETLQVKVEGNLVSQSDTNGWSYVVEENRIQFHGSAKPSHSDNVEIVYQVQ